MEDTMDIARKIGIAIVMIVPTFVIAGALWDIFHSWLAVLIWVLLVAGFVGGLLSGKFSRSGGSTGISDPGHAHSH
jgi:membrane protein required for beta-lactamase induction